MRRVTRGHLVLPLLALGACAPSDPSESSAGAGAPAPRVAPPEETLLLPAVDERDRLQLANHRRWVSGDIAGARVLLREIVATDGASGGTRALAALWLADMAEIDGDRRRALGLLDRARALAGPGHGLSQEAEDRRSRILTATPLADVRGPVPGSVGLRGEHAAVLGPWRQAEKMLAAYHRVIVAPSLENVSEVLRRKRRSLAVAVAAYQRVVSLGGPVARAAAHFRMGAMCHHLAEALAFESPSELLPSVAQRLRRELRAESTNHLRKALGHYRSAAELPRAPGSEVWQRLAQREVATLTLVLKRPARRPGG